MSDFFIYESIFEGFQYSPECLGPYGADFDVKYLLTRIKFRAAGATYLSGIFRPKPATSLKRTIVQGIIDASSADRLNSRFISSGDSH